MWALKPTSWFLLAEEGGLKIKIVLGDAFTIFSIVAAFAAVFRGRQRRGGPSISDSDAGGLWVTEE